MKPVCLVLGAGAGIGGTVAAKFAAEGYHACLCRRSDQEGLDQMVKKIEEEGGAASGHLINAIEENVLEELIISIEKDHGPIEVLVYNLGAQSGMKLLQETSIKEFEWAWRIADLDLQFSMPTQIPLLRFLVATSCPTALQDYRQALQLGHDLFQLK